MVWFFIKKNFCDGWDNLLWLMAFNLLILGIGIGVYYGLGAIIGIATLPEWAVIALSIPFFAAGVFLISTILFSVSDVCAKIADFKSSSYKEVFTGLKNCWKDAILFSLMITVLVILAVIAIPFYLRMGGLIGIFLAALVFWMLCLCAFSLQWFLPLRSQLHGGFKKTLKKCFIIFFDNSGFSVFMFFYSLILAALSVFLAFLVPGLAGIALAQNNAFRLRLYKYDWLEKHTDLSPREARKHIPWGELIAEDRETLGPRTLRSFIFPWKD